METGAQLVVTQSEWTTPQDKCNAPHAQWTAPQAKCSPPPAQCAAPRPPKAGKRSAARRRGPTAAPRAWVRVPAVQVMRPEHGCMAPPHKCRTPSVSGGRGWLIGSTEGQSLLFCLQKTRPATAYDSARISKRETWHQTTGIGSATGGEKKPATLNGPVSECRG